MKTCKPKVSCNAYDMYLIGSYSVLACRLQNVGEQGHMALLGHSLAAYISVLDKERLRKLTTRILSDTTLWLCRLFRWVIVNNLGLTRY